MFLFHLIAKSCCNSKHWEQETKTRVHSSPQGCTNKQHLTSHSGKTTPRYLHFQTRGSETGEAAGDKFSRGYFIFWLQANIPQLAGRAKALTLSMDADGPYVNTWSGIHAHVSAMMLWHRIFMIRQARKCLFHIHCKLSRGAPWHPGSQQKVPPKASVFILCIYKNSVRILFILCI